MANMTKTQGLLQIPRVVVLTCKPAGREYQQPDEREQPDGEDDDRVVDERGGEPGAEGATRYSTVVNSGVSSTSISPW
jgi:hypothetical protein